MTTSLESLGKNAFALKGNLDFQSVVALWEQTQDVFREQPPLHIDLAGVKRSDSSGVALLVEWLRQARVRNQHLRFTNMPPQMQAIVRVADLDQVLHVDQVDGGGS
jgi:phospholipid transport system transporter-binding protein